MSQYLYAQLEQTLREQIESGQLASGAKLPSIRALCQQQKLSKSTVLAAFSRLEAEGLIEAKNRAGYFVSASSTHRQKLTLPSTSQPKTTPLLVSSAQVLLDIMNRTAAFDLLPNGEEENHNPQLRRCLSRALRRQDGHQQHYYDSPLGNQQLRQQVAQWVNHSGSNISADELIITSGCQHAQLLALMATTEPGDVVAIESPGFYGAFQLLEMLGLKALELPSSVDEGISPQALSLALQHWDIKVLWLSPSYSTPTGACMPDTNKQQILALTQARDIPIIEDDIYAELYFGLNRPRSIYSFDNQGSVLLCSSLSKSVSRDLRLGWIAPGRYHEKVQRLKLVTSLANSASLQEGVSQFIAEGGLEKHLRHTRRLLQQQCSQLHSLIYQHIPSALSASQPQGGMALWLELDHNIDTLKLYHNAREAGILLTPGQLFSAQGQYPNFLRMSFAHPWTQPRTDALQHLGKMIAAL
ncbi:MAG: PLP-dependent aminotransferase family protein [Pseudomonadales bacterium]